MKWFKEHKPAWRMGFLLMLVLAITGPWAFDRVSVPLPHTCSPPNIRLDDDFCGVPLSITWFVFTAVGELFDIVGRLFSGALRFASAVTQLRVFLFLCLLLFPVLSTVVLIWRGGGRRWGALHIAGLGLAAGVSVWRFGMGYFTAGWVIWNLWGPWLYILLTASLFVLEAFVSRTLPGLAKEDPPEKTVGT